MTNAINAHLANISSRNVPAILSGYASNALVDWKGQTLGLGGNYSGKKNIQLLFAAAIGTAQKLNVTASNIQSIPSLNGEAAATTQGVALHIDTAGKSLVLGAFTSSVDAQIIYQQVGTNWLISSETWNYVNFFGENTGGATTFPEWQKVGPPKVSVRGPDWLHNFAWDYGGLGAAFLVFLSVATIAVVFAVKRPWKQ